jgi:hypothetical protein
VLCCSKSTEGRIPCQLKQALPARNFMGRGRRVDRPSRGLRNGAQRCDSAEGWSSHLPSFAAVDRHAIMLEVVSGAPQHHPERVVRRPHIVSSKSPFGVTGERNFSLKTPVEWQG